MTIYDDAAAKLIAAAPKSIRWGQLVPISKVAYVLNAAQTFNVLTVFVDLGSGPVPALMSRTFMTYLLGLTNSSGLPDFTAAVGQLAIVQMTPSPTVIDLVGSTKLSYP